MVENSMTPRVIDAKYLYGFILELKFNDGKVKRVDLEKHLEGEIFEPLKDVDYFKTVKVYPEHDTIYWDNTADFAPEFLYEIGEDVEAITKVV